MSTILDNIYSDVQQNFINGAFIINDVANGKIGCITTVCFGEISVRKASQWNGKSFTKSDKSIN